MTNTTANLITVEDYRALPEGPPHYQLIAGKLHMSPSPTRYHQVVCRNIQFLLMKYLEQHPVGEVFQAPSDVYLTEFDVYQPDLFFVSNENAAVLSPQGAAGAPDLVIEVLSPGTARLDREAKRKTYTQVGVKELWLVDPDLKVVQVYQASRGLDAAPSTYGMGASFSSPFFPGLHIPVADVFKPSRLG